MTLNPIDLARVQKEVEALIQENRDLHFRLEKEKTEKACFHSGVKSNEVTDSEMWLAWKQDINTTQQTHLQKIKELEEMVVLTRKQLMQQLQEPTLRETNAHLGLSEDTVQATVMVEKYRKMAHDLQMANKTILAQLEDSRNEFEKLLLEKQQTVLECSNLKQELSEERQHLNELFQTTNVNNTKSGVKDEMDLLQEQVRQLQIELVARDGKLKTLAKEKEKLTAMLNDAQIKVFSSQEQFEQMRLEKLQEMSQLKVKKNRLQEELNNVKIQSDKAEWAYKEDLQHIKAELDEYKQELHIRDLEVIAQAQEVSKTHQRKDTLQRDLTAAEDFLKEQQKQLVNLRAKLEIENREAAMYPDYLRRRHEDVIEHQQIVIGKLRTELVSLTGKLEQFTSRVRKVP